MTESPTDLLSNVATIRFTDDTNAIIKKLLKKRCKQTPGLKKTHIMQEALILGLAKMDQNAN